MDTHSKETHVQSVFQKVAPKYDLMNDLISFRRHKAWRKFTMKQMNVQPGDTAIDLCCGTCDWTIAIAKASQNGRTVGLDFSSNMLEVGRKKVDKEGLSNQIELIQGNAMELPFPDNSFDYATIGFGLRNVADYSRVLQEMQRVVKPGGRVVCLETSKPTWQPFKSIYYLYFERILPLMGRLVAKSYEQYKWLPESLKAFPGREELAQMYREIGLQNVQAFPLTGGVAALHIGVKGKDKA
ncbi:demethylmenaquinone methyltransferase/2-methoxy-6-polyprenyl-1,4-benzoquinol methylase [Paenibacillus cellulosilyticus]|uniref:Demethylmenaquinone methyltransferase n=1 Tax=Paenibacillus cellulosilyticus TaxID=375489 RepID=A0A2V2YYP1_9BACL|nr:demethylmenaquinone methyltransferase [Paenibacillus cellulosilyticus]PWW05554.1 demethylmenaquinone methyltransferase/2-methoxy-6-polyprenyl-1,4-benzoquinol methylase [Paenibacillus cellulosilyticus]QKS45410.1 demethylmenaquinone methyltransferase [Paenibacillus cellulosilyticus]